MASPVRAAMLGRYRWEMALRAGRESVILTSKRQMWYTRPAQDRYRKARSMQIAAGTPAGGDGRARFASRGARRRRTSRKIGGTVCAALWENESVEGPMISRRGRRERRERERKRYLFGALVNEARKDKQKKKVRGAQLNERVYK